MKTYTVKSSAHRAAKQAGLSKDQYEIVEIDGQFGYRSIGEVEEAPVVGEFTHCPHCGVHLNNGYSLHLDEVNGKQIKHRAFEYACMACEGEFGEAISVAKPKQASRVNNRSTIERPTKTVWLIADEMVATNPQVRRKEVIEECVRRGIAFYTARTQYQQWLAANKGSHK